MTGKANGHIRAPIGMSARDERGLSQVYITEHHEEPCEKCADDASKYNHCAFCGEDCANQSELIAHLDLCAERARVIASL